MNYLPQPDSLSTQDAIAEMHRIYGPQIIERLKRRYPDEDPEDLWQDTLVRWLARANRDNNFKICVEKGYALAARTAGSLAIDHFRKKSVRPKQVPLDDLNFEKINGTIPSSEDQALANLGQGVVSIALSRLTDKHRNILNSMLEGFTVDEIADSEGIPKGTVRSRKFYGMRALRQAIESGEMSFND